LAVRALAAAGQNDQAKRAAEAAEQAVATITAPDTRARALALVAEALAAAGHANQGERPS
jgi:hypothetical protein